MGNIRVDFRPQGIIPRDSSLSLELSRPPVVPGAVALPDDARLIMLPSEIGVHFSSFAEGDFGRAFEVTNNLGIFNEPTTITIGSSNVLIASPAVQFVSIAGKSVFLPVEAPQIITVPSGDSGTGSFAANAWTEGSCLFEATAPGYKPAFINVTVTKIPRGVIPRTSGDTFLTSFVGSISYYGKTTKGTYTVDLNSAFSSPGFDQHDFTSIYPAIYSGIEPAGITLLSYYLYFTNNTSVGVNERVSWAISGSGASGGTFGGSDVDQSSNAFLGAPSMATMPNKGMSAANAHRSWNLLSPPASGLSITVTSSYQPMNIATAFHSGGTDNGFGAPVTIDTLTFQLT